MSKIWEYFEKEQVIVCDYRTQLTARTPDNPSLWSKFSDPPQDFLLKFFSPLPHTILEDEIHTMTRAYFSHLLHAVPARNALSVE